MTSSASRRELGRFREVSAICVLTVLGTGLRLWRLPQLGLVHFDEGVYALAGLWAFLPGGLAAIDPASIAYSPPGFPVLVGLAYLYLGPGDVSAIGVSILCGAVTIPAVGWLAVRSFGRGAGAAAAALAAFAGPHVAFSRMALTDASFLLVWILALALGQRFLAQPGPLHAVALGLSVGLAQLLKYNGWISGIIVALTAALGHLLPPPGHDLRRALATWGWGLLAALVAAAVYWPYFRFVERHGGYAALLAHQSGYLGGISSWPSYLRLQLAQSRLLSGGPSWLLCGGAAAALAAVITSERSNGRQPFPRALFLGFIVFMATYTLFDVRSVVALGGAIAILGSRDKRQCDAMRLLAAGWVTLMVLTPFYHPYARLWLPLEAFGWLFVAGFLVSSASGEIARVVATKPPWRSAGHLAAAAVFCVGAAVLLAGGGWWFKPGVPGILRSTDSLRLACRRACDELPGDVERVHCYGRPAAAFYLTLYGRAAVSRLSDSDELFDKSDSHSWAVLDTALLRQQGSLEPALKRIDGRFVVVRSYDTTLNLPTLLDIDPSAALAGPINDSAPLLLLRPKLAGEKR
jgi:dolichyl-phosphate-mannose-protein mannosyltransferase